MSKKGMLYCGLFNCLRVYNVLNPQVKMNNKQFLLPAVRDWITDDNNEGSLEPETNLFCSSAEDTKRTPHKYPPKRTSSDKKLHEPTGIPVSGKKKFLQEPGEFASPMEKGVNLDIYVNFAWCLLGGKCFMQYYTFKKY